MKTLTINESFTLESGETLPELEIGYFTYGELSPEKDNVIWICHALTGNADAADWWSGLVGKGRIFDPEHYFIVCANMLGSCYGTTGPVSINPLTGKKYAADFPLVTVRDMVRVHQLLQQHLEIETIKMGIGGSMGGQQVLEWAIMDPDVFEHVSILASNAQHSPWGIAFNEAQRMAIRADLERDGDDAGRRGLEAARAMAMLSYRNYKTYNETQVDEEEKLDDFRASSYQRYQGNKLWQRFDVHAYVTLGKAMDSHNVGRGRGGLERALKQIKAKALVIGIQSDILFPIEEQIFIANKIPVARLEVLDSMYGHDGFLVEFEIITGIIRSFLEERVYRAPGTAYKRRLLDKPITIKSNRRALPGTEPY